MENNKNGKLITQEDVVKLFRISRSSIYRLRRKGQLNAYKLPGGSKVYIDKTELESLFEAQPI